MKFVSFFICKNQKSWILSTHPKKQKWVYQRFWNLAPNFNLVIANQVLILEAQKEILTSTHYYEGSWQDKNCEFLLSFEL